MTRRMGHHLANGMDRDGFTVGVSLDWGHVFLGLCGLGFAILIFFVGLVTWRWVLCDS